MAKIRILPIEDIAAENVRLTGNPCDPARKEAAAGCLSSFHYYADIREQIASIVAGLAKGHYFVDGNKRTALSTYLALSRANGIDHIRDAGRLVETFVELAASRRNVPECAAMLFPGRSPDH